MMPQHDFPDEGCWTLPQTIPGARVIRTDGVEYHVDNTHFTSAGYRELGRRYAGEMFSILGYSLSE
jgi:lysophospholipase L1-like esterase